MPKGKDNIIRHPVSDGTWYTELHDAFVEEWKNKGRPSMPIHAGKGDMGEFVYISDTYSKVQRATSRRDKARERVERDQEIKQAAQDRKKALELLFKFIKNEIPSLSKRANQDADWWRGVDLVVIHKMIAAHYTDESQSPKLSTKERRVAEILAEKWHRHANKKKATTVPLGNMRAQASGLWRLENAVQRELTLHGMRATGRSDHNAFLATFSSWHLERFIKPALGNTRLQGLTFGNIGKLKAALKVKGVLETPHLDALHNFLRLQHKYEESYRQYMLNQIQVLRSLQEENVLNKAMEDAGNMAAEMNHDRLKQEFAQAIAGAENALRSLDKYMGKARGNAGIDEQERKKARLLLADATKALNTTMRNLGLSPAAKSLHKPMRLLFDASVELNRLLETPAERANFEKDQEIIPNQLIQESITLPWNGVLNKRIAAPGILTSMTNPDQIRTIVNEDKNRLLDVYAILWRKPGSRDGLARSFLNATDQYNNALQGVKTSYSDFGTGDSMKSNEKLAALRARIDVALDANATMLSQLNKATARHGQQAVNDTYRDLLERKRFGGMFGWLKKLFSRCCCGFIAAQRIDNVELPDLHQERIDESSARVSASRKEVLDQREALLELSRYATVDDLQRRAIVRSHLGLEPNLNPKAVGRITRKYGQERLRDYQAARSLAYPDDRYGQDIGSEQELHFGNFNPEKDCEEEDPLDTVPPLRSDMKPGSRAPLKLTRDPTDSQSQIYLAPDMYKTDSRSDNRLQVPQALTGNSKGACHVTGVLQDSGSMYFLPPELLTTDNSRSRDKQKPPPIKVSTEASVSGISPLHSPAVSPYASGDDYSDDESSKKRRMPILRRLIPLQTDTDVESPASGYEEGRDKQQRHPALRLSRNVSTPSTVIFRSPSDVDSCDYEFDEPFALNDEGDPETTKGFGWLEAPRWSAMEDPAQDQVIIGDDELEEGNRTPTNPDSLRSFSFDEPKLKDRVHHRNQDEISPPNSPQVDEKDLGNKQHRAVSFSDVVHYHHGNQEQGNDPQYPLKNKASVKPASQRDPERSLAQADMVEKNEDKMTYTEISPNPYNVVVTEYHVVQSAIRAEIGRLLNLQETLNAQYEKLQNAEKKEAKRALLRQLQDTLQSAGVPWPAEEASAAYQQALTPGSAGDQGDLVIESTITHYPDGSRNPKN